MENLTLFPLYQTTCFFIPLVAPCTPLLGNPDNDNGTTLDLPAKPWELLDALERLRLREGQEPYWQVEDLGRYDFLEPHLDKCGLYQFNALAEQLSTFNEADAIAFEGLVQMESDKLHQENGGEPTIQRMLDLAYSVDCCHVVPEVRDDAALGKFYVENDFLPELEKVPDKVLEMLDYAKIGRTMRQGEQSVITPHGYVEQHSELKQAPADLGKPPRKPAYMMRFLCSNEHQTMPLNLPASQAELNAVLMRLDLDSWQEVYLECEDTAMPEMWSFTDMAYDGMEQLNRFAQCLEELDRNNELIKFKAVAGQLDIRSLDDALALAEHLSEYALEPGIHSLEELAREELSVIVGDPDGDLLTRHLNMEAYGADLLWRDHGLFSDYGYICRPDGQPLQVPRQGVDMTMQ